MSESSVQVPLGAPSKVRAAVAQLAESLERGRSEELIAFMKALARFHHYSLGNVVLILDQKPDASRVAGRNTWKELGRKPNRTAIGIVINVPILPQWMYELPPAEKKPSPFCLGFREGRVFDVSQTSGDPLPKLPKVQGNPGGYLRALKESIRARGINLVYRRSLAPNVLGLSLGGKIVLRSGFPPAEEFRVGVHELAHELLHQRKRNFPRLKSVTETEAEAVAFVVSTAVGLDLGTVSSDYIRLHNGSVHTLNGSIWRIQHLSKAILQDLEGRL